MYHIMIVDDEIQELNHLRSVIPYEEYGFRIVCEARSGAEALEQYRLHRPELVITDIVMPGMDGLETVRAISELESSCCFILLSSYNEFDYAQQAISLEVKSYILKHRLTKEILARELTRIAKFIDDRQRRYIRSRREQFDRLLEFCDDYSAAALSQKLEDLLGDKIPFAPGRTLLLAVRCSLAVETMSLLEEGERELRDPVLQQLGSRVQFLTAHKDLAMLLLVMPSVVSHTKWNMALVEVCQRMQQLFHTLLHCTCCIGVSAPMQSAADFAKAKHQSEAALKAQFFQPQNHIYNYPYLQRKEQDFQEERDALFAQMETAAKSRDFESLNRHLGVLLLDLHASLANEAHYASDLALLAGLLLRHCNIDISTTLDAAADSRSIREAHTALCGLLDAIRERSRISPKMQEILGYIEENLSENISLVDIADATGLNSIYVSQIFKKEMGVNFKTYLTGRRIQLAKELLYTKQYKVSQVAEMAGYQTLQHFSSSFRKATGHSPGQYCR